jgi:hypothetical protein
MRYTLLAAGAAILLIFAVALFVVDGEGFETNVVDSSVDLDGSELRGAAAADPAQVIEDYRIAYNSGDIEGVMALFSDESVLRGHPFSVRSTGLVAIRRVQFRDLAIAAPADAYRIANVEVSGDTATWDHVFTNSEGTRWCGEGHSAVIADGKILNWDFAPDRHECSTPGSERLD